MDQGDIEAARPLVLESLTIRRELSDLLGLSCALQYQSRIALADNSLAPAHAGFTESLTLRHEMGKKWGSAVSLEQFAALADRQQDWARAVQLWAAAETLCTARRDHERCATK